MKFRQFLNHILVRNLLGILALLAVHYVSDQYTVRQRSGFNQFSPYLFLLLLYGWMVFHNRFLFERLYRRNKQSAYFGWMLLAMTISSLNMHNILSAQFNVTRTLPYIVSFWVYTVTGLGVYVLYHLQVKRYAPAPASPPMSRSVPTEAATLVCVVNGETQAIPCADILYVESLENYVKVNTQSKAYITRLTLKEAEERLPKPLFVRISRSHIVNTNRIETVGQDMVKIGPAELRIGKVYKRYVAGQLAGTS